MTDCRVLKIKNRVLEFYPLPCVGGGRVICSKVIYENGGSDMSECANEYEYAKALPFPAPGEVFGMLGVFDLARRSIYYKAIYHFCFLEEAL